MGKKNEFEMITQLAPKGSSFHPKQRGEIIWISKQHLQKVEKKLQAYRLMKGRTILQLDILKANIIKQNS